MTSTKRRQSTRSDYSSHRCFHLGKLIRAVKDAGARRKMLLCVLALTFLVPLSAFAAAGYNASSTAFHRTLLGVAGTGNDQADTFLQLMTAFSVFAVVGFVGQRCTRYFQKRRLRRPFHIWNL